MLTSLVAAPSFLPATTRFTACAPTNRFLNHYVCTCGCEWHDVSACTNDDRCPDCALSSSPVESEDLDPVTRIPIGAELTLA